MYLNCRTLNGIRALFKLSFSHSTEAMSCQWLMSVIFCFHVLPMCLVVMCLVLQLCCWNSRQSCWCVVGLLASTLFVFKDRACNNEKLLMRCPPGTGISVRWAQYGRPSSGDLLCPPIERLREEQQLQQRTQPLRKLHHRPFNESTSSSLECLAPTSLQVRSSYVAKCSICILFLIISNINSIACDLQIEGIKGKHVQNKYQY